MVLVSTHHAKIPFENEWDKFDGHTGLGNEVPSGKCAKMSMAFDVCKQFGALKPKLGLDVLNSMCHHGNWV